ncbi:hypothetical protein [Ornithinibacillus bavariensis]|uniref:Uncharacterized protein n=1 Tax=Ornithinibacillus bavariensis TaxID=545502 RepID=A0A919X4Q7_9BACI|nr:hypothetical protein [Ornithinibacillus bavariensis]GIO25851.1 hypothetical protein J43TS3_04620 [Ornithinibacillus bavariensis]
MIRIVLAGFFSLVFPGIGQLFNRQWIKGISFIVIELCLLYFATPEVWVVMIYRVIWLISIIDASVIAYLVYKGKKELHVLKGWRAVLVVGLANLIILPIALLPSLLPHISYYLAVTQMTDAKGGSAEQLQEEKKIYEDYLVETYGEEFSLGDATFNSNYGHYLVDASPKTNPNLVFGVYQDWNDKINDSYIDTLWGEEARNEVSPIIEKLYEDVWMNHVEVAIKAGSKEKILIENKQIIGFNEGRSKYPQDYYYWVELLVFQDYDNPEQELEKLYEIITYFKNAEIQVTSFDVKYYDETLLEKEGSDIEPGYKYNEYATHFISLNKDKINQINSIKDLEEHMITLE